MHAVQLTTATIAGATGGTFADSFAAATGDSLTVATYSSGGARVFSAWGIDSDSIAEIAWYYGRTDSTQDTTYGLRTMIPAVALGGAATNASFNILGLRQQIPVFSADVPTIKASSTASDDLVMAYLTEYDNLPGASASFDSWTNVNASNPPVVSFVCNAVASGTVGQYGSARALNTDDTRWVAQRYYAILGFSVKTQVTTVALKLFETGNLLLGAPMGALHLDQRNYFVDLSYNRNKPLIPIMLGTNAGNGFMYISDAEASTSPKVDVHCLLLPPTYTPPAAT